MPLTDPKNQSSKSYAPPPFGYRHNSWQLIHTLLYLYTSALPLSYSSVVCSAPIMELKHDLLGVLDDVLGPTVTTATHAGSTTAQALPQAVPHNLNIKQGRSRSPRSRRPPGGTTSLLRHARRPSGATQTALQPRLEARHEAVERDWDQYRETMSAALVRPPSQLVFSRSEAWRDVSAKRELLELLAGMDRETDTTVSVETWAASLRNPLHDARFHEKHTGVLPASPPGGTSFSPVRFVQIGGPTSPLYAPLKDPAAKRARLFAGMSRGQLRGLRSSLLAELGLQDPQPPADGPPPLEVTFPSLAASYRAGTLAATQAAHATASGHYYQPAADSGVSAHGALSETSATSGLIMAPLLAAEYDACRVRYEARTTAGIRRRTSLPSGEAQQQQRASQFCASATDDDAASCVDHGASYADAAGSALHEGGSLSAEWCAGTEPGIEAHQRLQAAVAGGCDALGAPLFSYGTHAHVQALCDAAAAADGPRDCTGGGEMRGAWGDGLLLSSDGCVVERDATAGEGLVEPWPVLLVSDGAACATAGNAAFSTVRLFNTGSTVLCFRWVPEAPCPRTDAFSASRTSGVLLPGQSADASFAFSGEALPPEGRAGYHQATWALQATPPLTCGFAPRVGLRAYVPPSPVPESGTVAEPPSARLERRLREAEERAAAADAEAAESAQAAAQAAADAARKQGRVRMFRRRNPGLSFSEEAWARLSALTQEALVKLGAENRPMHESELDAAWAGSLRQLQRLVDSVPIPPEPAAPEQHPPAPAAEPAKPAGKAKAAPASKNKASAEAVPEPALAPASPEAVLEPSPRDLALRWKRDASAELSRVALGCAEAWAAARLVPVSHTKMAQTSTASLTSTACDSGTGAGGPSLQLSLVDVRLRGRIMLFDSGMHATPRPLLRAAAEAPPTAASEGGEQSPPPVPLPVQAVLAWRAVQRGLPSIKYALACGAGGAVVALPTPPSLQLEAGVPPLHWVGLARALSAELPAHPVLLLGQPSDATDTRCYTLASAGEVLAAEDARATPTGAAVEAALAGGDCANRIASAVRSATDACRRLSLPAPLMLVMVPAEAQQPRAALVPLPSVLIGSDPREWAPWEAALWLRSQAAHVAAATPIAVEDGSILGGAQDGAIPDVFQRAMDRGVDGAALYRVHEGTTPSETVFGPLPADVQAGLTGALHRLFAASNTTATINDDADGDPAGNSEAAVRRLTALCAHQAALMASLSASVDAVCHDSLHDVAASARAAAACQSGLPGPLVMGRARALALLKAAATHGPPSCSGLGRKASSGGLRRALSFARPQADTGSDSGTGGDAPKRDGIAILVVQCIVRAFLGRRRAAQARAARQRDLDSLRGITVPAQWGRVFGFDAFGLPRPQKEHHLRHASRLPAKLPALATHVLGLGLVQKGPAALADACGAIATRVAVPSGCKSPLAGPLSTSSRLLSIIGGGGGTQGALMAACERLLQGYLPRSHTLVLTGAVGLAWVAHVQLPALHSRLTARSQRMEVQRKAEAAARATAEPPAPAPAQPLGSKPAGVKTAQAATSALSAPSAADAAVVVASPLLDLPSLVRSVVGRSPELWEAGEWHAAGDVLRRMAALAAATGVRIIAPVDFTLMGPPAFTMQASSGAWEPTPPPDAPNALPRAKSEALRILHSALVSGPAGVGLDVATAEASLFTWRQAAWVRPTAVSAVPSIESLLKPASLPAIVGHAPPASSSGSGSKGAATPAPATTGKAAVKGKGSTAAAAQAAAPADLAPTAAAPVADSFVVDIGPAATQAIQEVLTAFAAAAAVPDADTAVGRGGAVVVHGPAGVAELLEGRRGTRAVLGAVASVGRRGAATGILGGCLPAYIFAHAAELAADGLSGLSFDTVA